MIDKAIVCQVKTYNPEWWNKCEERQASCLLCKHTFQIMAWRERQIHLCRTLLEGQSFLSSASRQKSFEMSILFIFWWLPPCPGLSTTSYLSFLLDRQDFWVTLSTNPRLRCQKTKENFQIFQLLSISMPPKRCTWILYLQNCRKRKKSRERRRMWLVHILLLGEFNSNGLMAIKPTNRRYQLKKR